MNHKNIVAKVLFIIGIIKMFLGFIFGIVMGDQVSSYSLSFSWSTFFMYTIGGFIVGMLFIGFAELIERQTETNELLKENLKMNKNYAGGKEIQDPDKNEELDRQSELEDTTKWIIDVSDKERIYHYFQKKDQTVQEIIESPIRDIVLVIVDNEHILMQVGGFIPSVQNIDQYPSLRDWYKEINEHT
ncbi:hypothetical protein ACERII_05520 [Evansella sp. AB-rgal1]|uniref:hypothetical protein n=1 Tax=Evansella sp. AB-rgal1 TaxID=3242696 RepID=UPI00359DBEF6